MNVHAPFAPNADLRLLSGLEAGTAIMTLRGEVAVEDLRPGDRVVTRDRGAVRLRHVDTRVARVMPVRIAAGLLGPMRPPRDLLLGPGTQILLRGAPGWNGQGPLPAALLVDGDFVTSERMQEMTLHRLQLGEPLVVYAEGIEVRT
jgi:hypothetical protein